MRVHLHARAGRYREKLGRPPAPMPRDYRSCRSQTDAACFPCAQVLCRYVGTNVIAATKIVKKHDKHVQPSLRKRVVVGNIIRNSKVLAELVQYSSTIQRGGAPSSKVTPSDSGITPTEEEAEMRGLPEWLLSGAKENDAASETAQSEEEPPGWHYPAFFSTYLDDW